MKLYVNLALIGLQQWFRDRECISGGTTIGKCLGALFSLSWNGTEPVWLKNWRIQSGASGFRRKSEPGRSSQARGWGALIPPCFSHRGPPRLTPQPHPFPTWRPRSNRHTALPASSPNMLLNLLQEYVMGLGNGVPGAWEMGKYRLRGL